MVYRLLQKIEKGNSYLPILWGQNYYSKTTWGYYKKKKKKTQRKDIIDKEQHMEEDKFSEHSRKHGQKMARGLTLTVPFKCKPLYSVS